MLFESAKLKKNLKNYLIDFISHQKPVKSEKAYFCPYKGRPNFWQMQSQYSKHQNFYRFFQAHSNIIPDTYLKSELISNFQKSPQKKGKHLIPHWTSVVGWSDTSTTMKDVAEIYPENLDTIHRYKMLIRKKKCLMW